MGGTVSENLFEQLCDRYGVQCRGLKPREGVRTADYLILLGGEKVVVEVKQIDPNDEDQELVAAANSGQRIGGWSDARFRARKKIRSAAGQIKSVAKDRCPSILVLFDNTGLRKLGSENILNAMYGDEVVEILVSDDPNEDSRMVGHRFGGGRQMTESERLYISAIGWLLRNLESGEWEIALFHNRFATLPLSPKIASHIAEGQYELSNAESDQYRLWKRVEVSN